MKTVKKIIVTIFIIVVLSMFIRVVIVAEKQIQQQIENNINN